MILSELLCQADLLDLKAQLSDQHLNSAVTGLSIDTRKVQPGHLFAGLPGSKADGASFSQQAADKGAIVSLISATSNFGAMNVDTNIPLVKSDDPRRDIAKLAAAFYGPAPAVSYAVTGTNGKTSVAEFTRQLLSLSNKPAISVGTLGMKPDGITTLPSLTSPDPISLHKGLSEAALQGYSHLVVEASSHGLDQRRLEGLRFDACAFTNFSQDHLDYHKDMAQYFAAKARLFSDLIKPGGLSVLSADTTAISDLASQSNQHLLFGWNDKADLRLRSTRPSISGQEISLSAFGEVLDFNSALIGDFQALNIAAAFGLCLASGLKASGLPSLVSQLAGVPGRMELVSSDRNDFAVVVDYAHTPDALEVALKAARKHCSGRLICLFGAGGDRDASKRPLMGRAAQDQADLLILTDDNPRSEDPAAIRADIKSGLTIAPIEIADRAQAISAALNEAQPGDMIVLAGKGHERGQILADKTIDFSDKDVTIALLSGS